MLNEKGDWTLGLGRFWYKEGDPRTIAQDCVTPCPTPPTCTSSNGCHIRLSDGEIIAHYATTQLVANGRGTWTFIEFIEHQDPTQVVTHDSFGHMMVNAYPVAIGPDGDIAVKPHSNIGCDVIHPNGTSWRLSDEDIQYVQLLGQDRALYYLAGAIKTVNMTVDNHPIGPEWGWPSAVQVGEKFLLLYQSYSYAALVLDGHVVEGGTTFFYPSAREIAPGLIRVLWYLDSSKLQARHVDLTLEDLLARPPIESLIPPPARPVGPTSDPVYHSDESADLLLFMLGFPNLWPRKGPSHPMNQVLDPTPGVFYFVKFDMPDAYEMWAYDNEWIYHLEDAANPPYSFLDPRWFKRHMGVGEEHVFDTGEHLTEFRERGTCRVLRREPFRRRMWVHAIYPSFYWGPDLGERETLVVAYDPTGGVHIPQRGVELGYYAKGAGSVRWEYYRSDMVYPPGSTSAQFPDEAREARSDFYLIGGRNTPVQITGCVTPKVPTTPVEPPIVVVPPKYPPISEHEVAMNQTVALIGPGGKYGSVDPSTKKLTFDRDHVGDWEKFVAEKPDDRGRHQLRSVSSGLILGVDSTQYGSNDIRKLYYLMEESKRGNYESFFLGKTPNGLILAMIEYIDQGVITKPFAPVNLTVVEL